MKIVVLAGGLSTERDVSFKSGDMVARALRRKGHQVLLLDVFMGYGDAECDISDIFDRAEEASVKVEDIPKTAPDIAAIRAGRKDQSKTFFGPNVIAICQAADIVFMALHGADGENGKVQAAFDLFGIQYTGNSYLPCAIAMDKGVAKTFFTAYGIPTPSGITLEKEERQDAAKKAEIHYPCVVKPACGGSSVGVTIVEDPGRLEEALDEAFYWEDEVVIEEYIKGREFSVGVMEDQVLPVIEIAPIRGFYDFKNKYAAGSAVETCPADLPQETSRLMQKYAADVCKVLGLTTYSRQDFLLDESGRIFCLEANTLPGMTPTSLLPQEEAVLGMSYDDLCEEIIRISLKKYQK